MEILYSTTNAGKLKAAQSYFLDTDITIVGAKINIEEPYINDIQKIAEIKAKACFEKHSLPCIANDSGFYIPSFPNNPNFPGAFVNRDLIEKLTIEGLIKKMVGVTDRYCYFKQCIVFYDGESYKVFQTETKGTLSEQIVNSPNENSWGELWSVFIPEGHSKTLSLFSKKDLDALNSSKPNILEHFSNWIKTEYSKRKD